jgi:hypothetical protein
MKNKHDIHELVRLSMLQRGEDLDQNGDFYIRKDDELDDEFAEWYQPLYSTQAVKRRLRRHIRSAAKERRDIYCDMLAESPEFFNHDPS